MKDKKTTPPAQSDQQDSARSDQQKSKVQEQELPNEIGGRAGPDPVRYGDWEKGGRCIDF